MRRFPGAACCLLLASLPCPAVAQLLGPEFQVNSYTTGVQGDSAVAPLGSGDFVVVWGSSPLFSGPFGVLGQRFDAAGQPLGAEFQVNSYTSTAVFGPAVGANDAGRFVIVWVSYGQDGSSEGVFGQRFDAAGAPDGDEFQVNTYTVGNQTSPSVAMDGSGGFVVSWSADSQDGSGRGVFGQRFDVAGTPIGSEFQVNTYTAEDQYSPVVAGNGAGGFVVVWQSFMQVGLDFDVFGRRFDADGVPAGGEFLVNTYTTYRQIAPKVAAGGSGEFVVIWQGYEQDGSQWGIFGQRFDAAGLPTGAEFQVNSSTAYAQYRPAVARDQAGSFLVTWTGFDQQGYGYDVIGQRFDAAGAPLGGEFRINSYTPDSQYSSAVARAGTGSFVVSWSSSAQDGSYGGVFGQRVTSALFADGFEAGDACAWSAAVGGGCP